MHNRNYDYNPARLDSRPNYSDRTFGRWFLAYSDFLLRRWGIPSKFIPYKGETEYIVVVNRNYGQQGGRKITNAADLIRTLKSRFKDTEQLKVWPQEFNFGSDVIANAKFARSIRILIGVHGAGMAHIIFMRPGTVYLELASYRCEKWIYTHGSIAMRTSMLWGSWSETKNVHHAGGCVQSADLEADVEAVADIVDEKLRMSSFVRDSMLLNAIEMMENP